MLVAEPRICGYGAIQSGVVAHPTPILDVQARISNRGIVNIDVRPYIAATVAGLNFEAALSSNNSHGSTATRYGRYSHSAKIVILLVMR